MSGPGPGSAELARAEVLVELQRWEDAIALLGRVVASDPSAARPRCLLAQALLGAGKPKAALEQARLASASDPNHEWPHRLQSIALHSLRDFVRAAAAAREAVRLAPTLASPYIVLVEAELALRHLAGAMAAADKAVELAPGLFSAHLARGRVELAKHHNRAAEDHFREALRLDPQSAAALNDLGRAMLGRGRFRAGVAYFGQASRLNPHNDVFRRNAIRGAIRAAGARVLACGAAATFGAVVASDQGWNPALGIALSLVALVGGVGAHRASSRCVSRDVDGTVGSTLRRSTPEPTVGHDVLRSLRRQATLKDIVVMPAYRGGLRPLMRQRASALARPLLVFVLGFGLILAYSATNGLMSPDPADPTSPTFYWGLLLVSSTFAAAAAIALTILVRRGRRPARWTVAGIPARPHNRS
jgi:tetratricopeptide (TPR) repeat protein